MNLRQRKRRRERGRQHASQNRARHKLAVIQNHDQAARERERRAA